MRMWLTQEQAAERAGVTTRTIRNWIAWGELQPRLGRFKEKDVIETEKRMRARRGRRKPTNNTNRSYEGGER
ncbi:helix-turn-helix domain-containing protein [Microbacterium testaceum]|nr:helix-turn-helix domain-containing protein [Microbacterium testaceum]MCC4250697.1 helix-turn-helix domain-containing protein [Microbacterium testaceum]